MSLVKISSKGQITIPVKIRNFLGVEAEDKLELLVKGDEVAIQPLKSFRNLRGSVVRKKGNAKKLMEKVVSKHVLNSDR